MVLTLLTLFLYNDNCTKEKLFCRYEKVPAVRAGLEIMIYFRQTEGRKTIRTVNISSLPISIERTNIHLAGSGSQP